MATLDFNIFAKDLASGSLAKIGAAFEGLDLKLDKMRGKVVTILLNVDEKGAVTKLAATEGAIKKVDSSAARAAGGSGGLSSWGRTFASFGAGLGIHSGKIGEVGKAFEETDKSAHKAAGPGSGIKSAGIGFLALGAAATVVIGESVNLAIKFDESTHKLAASAGISVDSAKKIGDAFLTTGGQTTFTATQMEEAFGPVAAKLGELQGHALSSNEALKFMNAAMAATEATGGDLNATTDALSKVMSNFHINVQFASSAADALTNASLLLNIPIADLADGMDKLHGKLGEAAPNLGEMSTLMVDLGNNAGLKGTKGVQVLFGAIEHLLGNSKEAKGEIQQLGLRTLDSTGHFVGMRSIIEQLNPKFAAMTEDQRRQAATALVGGAAQGAFNKIISDGVGKYDELTNKITASGSAQEAAEKRTNDLKGNMEKFKAAIQDAAVSIGNAFIPTLTRIVQFIAPVILAISRFIEKHPVLVAVVLGAVAAIGILIGIIWALGFALSVLMAHPIIAVIVGIAALVIAIVALELKFHFIETAARAVANFFKGPFVDAFKHVWEFLQQWGPAILAVFLPFIGIPLLIIQHWGVISGFFGRLWADITGWVSRTWHDVTGFFGRMWGDVTGWAARLWGDVTGWFGRTWHDVTGWAGGIWHDVSGFFGRLWGDVTGWAGRVWGDVTGWFGRLWHDVTGWAGGIWHDVTGWFGRLWADTVGRTVSGVLDTINWFGRMWHDVTGWVAGLWHDVTDWFGRIWGDVTGWASRLWHDVTDLFGRTWHDVTGWVSRLWSDVTGWFGRLWSDVTGWAGRLWGDITGWFGRIWGDVTGWANRLWHDVVETFNHLKDGLIGVFHDIANFAFFNPVNWVIRFVINGGIGGIVNTLHDIIGTPAWRPVGELHPFAKGGVVPGYAPGHDTVHAILSPGEGILVPEAVRMLGGPGAVHHLNSMSSGRVGHQNGSVQTGFSFGGIISDIWGDIKGAAGAVWDSIKDAGKWVQGKLGDTAQFILDHTLYPIVDHAATPGIIGQLPKALTHKVGQQIVDLLKGKDVSYLKSFVDIQGQSGARIGPGAQAAMAYAASQMARYGWGPEQMAPLISLWIQESGWNPLIVNGSSGAYGIPQALPASKMAAAGPDWRTNPATQINWGLGYIKGRYGSPSGAWAHERAFNWYGNGGFISNPTIAGLGESGRELVLPLSKPRRTEHLLSQAGLNKSVPIAMDIHFAGNTDTAFATAFMKMVRSGQIQIKQSRMNHL